MSESSVQLTYHNLPDLRRAIHGADKLGDQVEVKLEIGGVWEDVVTKRSVVLYANYVPAKLNEAEPRVVDALVDGEWRKLRQFSETRSFCVLTIHNVKYGNRLG